MNQVQQTYKAARDTYDTLYALSGQKQEEVLATSSFDLDSDEGLEAYCEIATHIEFEIGLPQASETYHNAEKALLAWGLQYSQTHQTHNNIVDMLTSLIERPNAIYMRKACDLLVKLPA